jgi:hypothetical protein
MIKDQKTKNGRVTFQGDHQNGLQKGKQKKHD